MASRETIKAQGSNGGGLHLHAAVEFGSVQTQLVIGVHSELTKHQGPASSVQPAKTEVTKICNASGHAEA